MYICTDCGKLCLYSPPTLKTMHKKSDALLAFENERLKSALITRTLIFCALVAVLAAVIVHQANN